MSEKMSEKKQITYTIKIGDIFESVVKEPDEDFYYPALKMIQSGKSIEAAMYLARNLYVSGDKVDEVGFTLKDKLALEGQFAEILTPTDASLKKNIVSVKPKD